MFELEGRFIDVRLKLILESVIYIKTLNLL